MMLYTTTLSCGLHCPLRSLPTVCHSAIGPGSARRVLEAVKEIYELKDGLLYGNEALGLTGSILVVRGMGLGAGLSSPCKRRAEWWGEGGCVQALLLPIFKSRSTPRPQGNRHEALWFGTGCMRLDAANCPSQGDQYYEVCGGLPVPGHTHLHAAAAQMCYENHGPRSAAPAAGDHRSESPGQQGAELRAGPSVQQLLHCLSGSGHAKTACPWMHKPGSPPHSPCLPLGAQAGVSSPLSLPAPPGPAVPTQRPAAGQRRLCPGHLVSPGMECGQRPRQGCPACLSLLANWLGGEVASCTIAALFASCPLVPDKGCAHVAGL